MKVTVVLEFDSAGLDGALGSAFLAAELTGSKIVRLVAAGKVRNLAPIARCAACGEFHEGRCLQSIG